MAKDDTVYLRHILDAINTIEEYLHGVNEDTFKATQLLQDGAIRQIEIIGEAVAACFKRPAKDLPRSSLAGYCRHA